jgi:NAD(P)-dependent dehydrogenase (short-subunit alcohol dehydrogenase family)
MLSRMKTIALVTGANQGLGLSLVRNLCRRLGDEGIVYLTSRNAERCEAAARALQREGLHPRTLVMDVGDAAAVDAVATELQAEYGGVDVVLSNAGARIAPGVPNAEQVRTFFETNNGGTHHMLNAFVPRLRDGGRFVVVASAFGRLGALPKELRSFFDPRQLSLADLDAHWRRYVELVETGRDAETGWPEWINVASKVEQVAAVRSVAETLREHAAQHDLLLNAVCPGLVDTDASRPWFPDMSQARSPDDAAVDVVWLATLPPGTREPYGHLVQYRKVLPFDA